MPGNSFTEDQTKNTRITRKRRTQGNTFKEPNRENSWNHTFWHRTQRDLALNTQSDKIRCRCAQLVQDRRIKNSRNTGNRTKNIHTIKASTWTGCYFYDMSFYLLSFFNSLFSNETDATCDQCQNTQNIAICLACVAA